MSLASPAGSRPSVNTIFLGCVVTQNERRDVLSDGAVALAPGGRCL